MISKTTLVFNDHDTDTVFARNKDYGIPNGWFMRYDPATTTLVRNTLASCREGYAFHWTLPTQNWMAFYRTPSVDIKLIDAFFVSIKKTLGIKDRTVFHRVETPFDPTMAARLVVIDVPPFWRENGMRRAIFTLMLRCAAVHFKGDLEASFKAYDLMTLCRPAIDLFLSGCVHPAYAFTSDFVFRTSGLKPEDLRRYMLREPVAIAPMPPLAPQPPPPPPPIRGQVIQMDIRSNATTVIQQAPIAVGAPPWAAASR